MSRLARRVACRPLAGLAAAWAALRRLVRRAPPAPPPRWSVWSNVPHRRLTAEDLEPPAPPRPSIWDRRREPRW